MAEATPVILSAERWLDEVLIAANVANTGGADFSDTVSHAGLGLGDLAIIEIQGRVDQIATQLADAVLGGVGVIAKVLSAAGSRNHDIIGVSRWYKQSATQLCTYFSPDPLVLWREGELLTFEGAEVDSNAVPTADFVWLIKCVRVRPIEGAVKGPIKLVNVSDM